MASSNFHPHLKPEPFISDHLPKNILIPLEEKNKLSLITWNICKPKLSNGFGIKEHAPDIQNRKERIIHSIFAFIKEKNPDMICLQEDFIFAANEEKESDTALKTTKEKLRNAGYEIIHDPNTEQTILYEKNKFTMKSTDKTISQPNPSYGDHTQKVVFSHGKNNIIINNVNLPSLLISRQNTERFITDSISADIIKERSSRPCSIFIGSFNLNVAPSALITSKNQILFGSKQASALTSTIYSSENTQHYTFTDGAFFAKSTNPFEDCSCQQANEHYDLDPTTGATIISTVSDETIKQNPDIFNTQQPVLNCGYRYDTSLQSYHLTMLEEAGMEMLRTVSALNKQEICLKFKDSNEIKAEPTNNDLLSALIHHTKKPDQPFLFNGTNHSVSIPLDKQTDLTFFLSCYRRIQAFEYIYADILSKYRTSSFYQKIKTKKKSFYEQCKAEGTSPFQKESVISKHAIKDKKSKGAIAYRLANNYYHLNFKSNDDLNKQIQQHIDGKFPKKKEKESKDENKKKWWKRN